MGKVTRALIFAGGFGCVASLLAISVKSAEVCIEEVAGVCIKYGDAKPAARTPPKPLSPEASQEASLRMSRDERRRVQERLLALKHYAGPIDGAFGDGTRRAIRQWQADAGQANTGYLSLDQFRALLSVDPPMTAAAEQPQRKQVAGLAQEPLAETNVAPDQPRPALLQPEPAAPKVDHPVKGRIYSHEYDMASIAKYTITVEREDAGRARIYLIADNGDSGFRKSCVVSLSGPFECYLKSRNWEPKRIFGTLPEVQLDLASRSPGGNRHRFWE